MRKLTRRRRVPSAIRLRDDRPRRAYPTARL